MRLKTFFFPLMLVISVSIFIGYVWPEITRLKVANEVKIAKTKELAEVYEKKNAIESIGNEISNSEGEKIIKDYLPEKKTEERIISGINYLANSSNVSLLNLSLTGDSGSTVNNSGVSAGLAGVLNPLANAESIVNNQVLNTPIVTNSAGSSIKTTTLNISISGSYDKVGIFLDGINTFPIFNEVRSVAVKRQQDEKKDGLAPADVNNLIADIVVDFGYMSVVKVDGQKVVSFNRNIDDDMVAVLKKYVSPEKQVADSVVDTDRGRINPFFSN